MDVLTSKGGVGPERNPGTIDLTPTTMPPLHKTHLQVA
jgi:hypothetical protein